MKLSDRFEIRGRKGDYVLTEYFKSKNPKSGEETTGKRTTYHPTLDQVANKIAKMYGHECLEIFHLDTAMRAIEGLRADIRGTMLEVKP